MKPEKRINLQIVSVENGYVVSEFDPVNCMMEGRRWVAESRRGLVHLVEDLCRGEAAESPGGAIAFTARCPNTPPDASGYAGLGAARAAEAAHGGLWGTADMARRSDTPPLVTQGRLINAAEASD